MDEQIEQIARAIAETVAEGDDIDIQEALENHFDWITPEQAKRMIDAAARAAHSVMAGTIAELSYHAEQLSTYLAQPTISEKDLASARWHNDKLRAALAPPRHD